MSSTNYGHTGLLNGLSHIGQVSLPLYAAIIPDRSLSNDDGDDNENGNEVIGLYKQNNNFARASRFFVHFLAAAVGLRRENAWFHALWKT